jgi:hypothetical protein
MHTVVKLRGSGPTALRAGKRPCLASACVFSSEYRLGIAECAKGARSSRRESGKGGRDQDMQSGSLRGRRGQRISGVDMRCGTVCLAGALIIR